MMRDDSEECRLRPAASSSCAAQFTVVGVQAKNLGDSLLLRSQPHYIATLLAPYHRRLITQFHQAHNHSAPFTSASTCLQTNFHSHSLIHRPHLSFGATVQSVCTQNHMSLMPLPISATMSSSPTAAADDGKAHSPVKSSETDQKTHSPKHVESKSSTASAPLTLDTLPEHIPPNASTFGSPTPQLSLPPSQSFASVRSAYRSEMTAFLANAKTHMELLAASIYESNDVESEAAQLKQAQLSHASVGKKKKAEEVALSPAATVCQALLSISSTLDASKSAFESAERQSKIASSKTAKKPDKTAVKLTKAEIGLLERIQQEMEQHKANESEAVDQSDDSKTDASKSKSKSPAATYDAAAHSALSSFLGRATATDRAKAYAKFMSDRQSAFESRQKSEAHERRVQLLAKRKAEQLKSREEAAAIEAEENAIVAEMDAMRLEEERQADAAAEAERVKIKELEEKKMMDQLNAEMEREELAMQAKRVKWKEEQERQERERVKWEEEKAERERVEQQDAEMARQMAERNQRSELQAELQRQAMQAEREDREREARREAELKQRLQADQESTHSSATNSQQSSRPSSKSQSTASTKPGSANAVIASSARKATPPTLLEPLSSSTQRQPKPPAAAPSGKRRQTAAEIAAAAAASAIAPTAGSKASAKSMSFGGSKATALGSAQHVQAFQYAKMRQTVAASRK